MSPVIMVNRERVLYEVIELARLKIAQRLNVPPAKVSAECHIGDESHVLGAGKLPAWKRFMVWLRLVQPPTSPGRAKDLRVKFEVSDAGVGFSQVAAKQVIQEEYRKVMVRIQDRFRGLGERWADGLPEKKETASEPE